jgi:ubiquinone biosynthesis protein COQ9
MKAKPQKILDSVLQFVPQYGWTDEAFKLGIKRAGLSEAQTRKTYPHGIEDIVKAFHEMIDQEMMAKIKAKRHFLVMRVREKITFALRTRLEIIEPHQESMRRLLVWSLHPRQVRSSARALWQTADAIWMAAGDTSTDYNYYTKRVLLIAVMKSTLLFWLQDQSAGYEATWSFLDRRIDDVMKLGKGLSVIKTVGVSDIISFMRERFAA